MDIVRNQKQKDHTHHSFDEQDDLDMLFEEDVYVSGDEMKQGRSASEVKAYPDLEDCAYISEQRATPHAIAGDHDYQARIRQNNAHMIALREAAQKEREAHEQLIAQQRARMRERMEQKKAAKSTHPYTMTSADAMVVAPQSENEADHVFHEVSHTVVGGVSGDVGHVQDFFDTEVVDHNYNQERKHLFKDNVTDVSQYDHSVPQEQFGANTSKGDNSYVLESDLWRETAREVVDDGALSAESWGMPSTVQEFDREQSDEYVQMSHESALDNKVQERQGWESQNQIVTQEKKNLEKYKEETSDFLRVNQSLDTQTDRDHVEIPATVQPQDRQAISALKNVVIPGDDLFGRIEPVQGVEGKSFSRLDTSTEDVIQEDDPTLIEVPELPRLTGVRSDDFFENTLRDSTDIQELPEREKRTHETVSETSVHPTQKVVVDADENRSKLKVFKSNGLKRDSYENSFASPKLTNQLGQISLKKMFQKARHVSNGGVTWQRAGFHFAIVALTLLGMASGVVFVGNAFATKDHVMQTANDAIDALRQTAAAAKGGDLLDASQSAHASHDLFVQAYDDLSQMNNLLVGLSRYIPGASKLASGDALVEASVHLSHALTELTDLSRDIHSVYARTDGGGFENFSVADVFEAFFGRSQGLVDSLNRATDAIDRVNVADVPREQRDEFIRLSRLLPPIEAIMEEAVTLQEPLRDLFGVHSPRTYLFLFQNNHEMRGSGGFIGSYGFLDIASGRIREFKIDGIYNPDGQLIDKVVPPRPIQKISAAWSLHDSNWWPHFPKSAEKAIDFYGRTGGPSVDGVIAVTPVMVERLLDITGPIALPEYDVTLTSKNFIQLTQYKVEIDYDKQENRPKKILSDLMPELLGALKKDLNAAKMTAISRVFLDGLRERHIMLYMRNEEIQDMITRHHWGGSLLETQDDYLSVVHSNINGFKTDGIITENISHSARISAQGQIINTVTVTREHGGGNTGYEWWDAVNADYMRVYVPQGSRLLEATGHTREWHEPRLDYETLGFEVDGDVAQEEDGVYVHPDSGTRVYDDTGKTVFGNWVYVSPGEKVTVRYVYELPWRYVTSIDADGRFASHSILFQKQAGAQNVTLESDIIYDNGLVEVASVPYLSSQRGSGIAVDASSLITQDFSGDVYRGTVFRLE